MRCYLCSEVNIGADHEISDGHMRNQILHEYSVKKKQFRGNRKGIIITCTVKSAHTEIENSTNAEIQIAVKPNEDIKFYFEIFNESNTETIQILFIKIPQNTMKFSMNNHGIEHGIDPIILKPKGKLHKVVYVNFKSPYIGQYEIPAIFSFRNEETCENIVFIRDMVVYVKEKQVVHSQRVTPFTRKNITATKIIRSNLHNNNLNMFLTPSKFKPIFGCRMNLRDDAPDDLKEMAADIRNIFEVGVTEENYVRFFHNLLWYEETIVRINLKKYNMAGVDLTPKSDHFSLNVPGLGEKRPSLMLGDLLLVKPQDVDIMFEAVISEINENQISIKGFNCLLWDHWTPQALFDVRFFMSRFALERMHIAVDSVFWRGHEGRIFPEPNQYIPKVSPITKFYNRVIENNPEQRLAVEHIVAGTSGAAPYLLHGPPGTGKTVTIVEAILQLVEKSPYNRVAVCTDSNMAADHVATLLIKYTHLFADNRLLLRANSKYRVWETLPPCLYPYSNGSSLSSFQNVSARQFMSYRIVITTLSHVAKYVSDFKNHGGSPITHLFIDEAAQATEPTSLIPIAGMLQVTGSLVLAGDPLQLGPTVIAHEVRRLGLGMSLMERLMKNFSLYDSSRSDPNYMVMLVNNFRSNKDILDLPNQLFYKYKLKNFAPEDPISRVDILDHRKPSRAIVFHGVLSQEQKMGKSPSFYNDMELDIIYEYLIKLVTVHKVNIEEIGIVTPYIRQVYKIRALLSGGPMAGVEVGTVEAFQGKEKRIILVSTVRANCGLLDYDAKFQLGFLVDDKRFNVALTRAKAKAIIIGNPLCLERDEKWRRYMDLCRKLGTYCGFDPGHRATQAAQSDMVACLEPMMQELNLSRAAQSSS